MRRLWTCARRDVENFSPISSSRRERRGKSKSAQERNPPGWRDAVRSDLSSELSEFLGVEFLTLY